MKTNIIKTGIAIIIAIACSYNAFCHSDEYQNPSSIKSPSQVELGKENNINQRVNPLVDKKDNIQNSDSGWVQKDGYLENALQVGSISYFRYSNDGQYLLTFGGDYKFRKWDVKTGKVVKELDFNYMKSINEEIFSVEVHPNDSIIAVNTIVYGQFSLNNVKSHVYKNDTLLNTFSLYDFFYKKHSNATYLFSVFYNSDIIFGYAYEESDYYHWFSSGGYSWWSLDSFKLQKEGVSDGIPVQMLLSKDLKYLIIGYKSYSDDNNCSLFLNNMDNNTTTIIDKFYHDKLRYSFHSLAFSNDSRYITYSKVDGKTVVWDINSSKTKYLINISNLMYNKFSLDDRFLITTLEKPDKSIIKFFLAETGVEADSIFFASKSHNGILSVSPDSINIAIAGRDGKIRIFQPKILAEAYKTYFAADSIYKQLGNAIKFSDYSLPNATSFHWDFGDGETSTEQNPIHYYQTKGLYTVKLISSNGAQTDTMIKKDYIRMLTPVVADFDVYINNDTIPFDVQFKNTSQGDIVSYKWDFGIQKTSIEENPTIVYDKWGIFDVKLIISDGYFSDTIVKKERIIANLPAIPFFTPKFEIRNYVDSLIVYGINGISTYDGGFLYFGDYYIRVYDGMYYQTYYSFTKLFKIDSLGNILWEQKTNTINDIIQTRDSCFLLFREFKNGVTMFNVSKINNQGELIWVKTYKSNRNDFVQNAFINEDGGFVAIGMSYYGNYQTVVLKADKNGNQLWYKYFEGTDGNILKTNDNNFLLVITNTYNEGIVILKKINQDGKELWSKNYLKDTSLIANAAIETTNGDFFIIGGTRVRIGNNYIYNAYFFIVDSIGVLKRENLININFSQYNSITNISDSLLAITGNFNNQIGIDIINNQGELVNSVRFPERVGAINTIVTTKENDLFLTGAIAPPFKQFQLYTLLLKHPYIITGIEDEQTENIANPEQPFSIFPNPTNSTATLQYKIETPTHLKIELINFIGMKVIELENSFKEADEYSTLINFESIGIAKGIYFVRFIANGNVFVSKVIYL